jgi:hypothetical protein
MVSNGPSKQVKQVILPQFLRDHVVDKEERSERKRLYLNRGTIPRFSRRDQGTL